MSETKQMRVGGRLVDTRESALVYEVVDLHSICSVCSTCGVETESRWGLPISSTTGQIVENEFDGEWGAIPACQACHDDHALGAFVGEYPKY